MTTKSYRLNQLNPITVSQVILNFKKPERDSPSLANLNCTEEQNVLKLQMMLPIHVALWLLLMSNQPIIPEIIDAVIKQTKGMRVIYTT